MLIGKEMADWCAANIAALDIVHCGEAGHHATEDHSKEIGTEIATWTDRHQLR